MKELLEIALNEQGVKEVSGEQHNQRIIQYAKESGFDWVSDDETPWCSIFANWVALKAGCERTNTATARDWLKVGEDVIIPQEGDIVVFKRNNSTWQGHVGFYISETKDTINVLGGNQGNQVKIQAYPKKDFLGYRRLHKISKDENDTTTTETRTTISSGLGGQDNLGEGKVETTVEKVIQKTKKVATTLNKPVRATNGYKTTVSVVVYLLVAILGGKVPFLSENEEVITQVLEFAFSLGILHKVFRWLLKNWRTIKDWSFSNLKLLITKFRKDGKRSRN